MWKKLQGKWRLNFNEIHFVVVNKWKKNVFKYFSEPSEKYFVIDLKIKLYKFQKAHDKSKELLRLHKRREFPKIVSSNEINFPVKKNLNHRRDTRRNLSSQVMVWTHMNCDSQWAMSSFSWNQSQFDLLSEKCFGSYFRPCILESKGSTKKYRIIHRHRFGHTKILNEFGTVKHIDYFIALWDFTRGYTTLIPLREVWGDSINRPHGRNNKNFPLDAAAGVGIFFESLRISR